MFDRPRRVSGFGPQGRGQALVEFALVLPVLLLVLLLAVDAGRLFFGWVALQNTARIGANFAADYPTAWSSGDTAVETQYDQQIQDDATTIDCVLPNPIPTPVFPDPAPNTYSIGSRAVVSLQCSFSLLTPFLGAILGNPVQLGASTVYPIRAGDLAGVPLPTPTPTATATPTATPSTCTVPTFLNTQSNQAQIAWNKAGFTPTNLIITVSGKGGQPYTIETESPPGSDGSSQPCATFQLTVAPS